MVWLPWNILGSPEFHVFLSLLGSPGYAWLEWPILRAELSLSPQLTCQVPHMIDSRYAWDSRVNSVPCLAPRAYPELIAPSPSKCPQKCNLVSHRHSLQVAHSPPPPKPLGDASGREKCWDVSSSRTRVTPRIMSGSAAGNRSEWFGPQ